MKLSQLLYPMLCATMLFSGCKGKDGDPGPAGATGATGATGPNLTGNMIGYVSAYDDNGNIAKAGTTVTIDNQTPALTTTTDANGKYQFSDLKTGTYNLTFIRTGYGTMKRYGVGHVGGDQPTYLGVQGMTVVATATITGFTFSPSSSTNSYTNYTITVSNPPANGARVSTYFGASPTVSSSNYLFYNSNYAANSPNVIYAYAYKSTLNSYGLVSGTTAYAISYATPPYSYSYSDPMTGLVVNPSLGTPSSVVSFIVP